MRNLNLIQASILLGLTTLAMAPAKAQPPERELAPRHVSFPNGSLEIAKAAQNEAARDNNGKAKPGDNGIYYHGGPLMLGDAHVYYIWYGNWANDTATSLLPAFASNVGCTPYYNINTSYYDGAGFRPSNAVSYMGSINDNYSRGKQLTEGDIQTIVSSAIKGTAPLFQDAVLPLDANAVYFVLTSPDVSLSGFCTSYCGWHTYAAVNGVNIKYSFVGNPKNCMSACSAQAVSPNGNAPADAMVSIIAHELSEAVTDPLLNAWYDRRGYENADKCAWTFGLTSTASNGSKFNVTMGGNQFLIQRNWVNAAGGSCAMSY